MSPEIFPPGVDIPAENMRGSDNMLRARDLPDKIMSLTHPTHIRLWRFPLIRAETATNGAKAPPWRQCWAGPWRQGWAVAPIGAPMAPMLGRGADGVDMVSLLRAGDQREEGDRVKDDKDSGGGEGVISADWYKRLSHRLPD